MSNTDIKPLIRRLAHENRFVLAGAVACTALAALMGFMTPAIMAEIIDHYLGQGPSRMPAPVQGLIASMGGREYMLRHLWIAGLAIILLQIINGLINFQKDRLSALASENVALRLRNLLYSHLQSLPFSYAKNAETGDLIQRCTSDVDTLRRAIRNQLMNLFNTVFMLGIALALLLPISVPLTLFSLGFMPVILIFSWLFFDLLLKTFKSAESAEARFNSVLQENLTGMRVVRAFGQGLKEIEKFEEANRSYHEKRKKLAWLDAFYWTTGDLFSHLQSAITFFICLIQVRGGTLSLGNLILFTSYTGMLVWPIRNFGRILSDMGKSRVALERINQVLTQEPEKNRPGSLEVPLTGDIVFENVCFSYESGQEVLHNLSFTIKAGQTAAFLGATGSGKSTIALLLQRLYEPDSGRISIGGHDIQSITLDCLRRHIGLVLQEPFLYSKTIKENLRMAAPDSDEGAIVKAASIARADGFIRESALGYDTAVGERGITLSGGQKQRIAIARTLLKDNEILIFDDSLSAVDTVTDAAIRKALSQLPQKISTLLISHRILTLSRADIIFVLDKGQVCDRGTHAELISRPGLYREIYQIQKGLSDEALLKGESHAGS